MRSSIHIEDGIYPHMPMVDYLDADAINSHCIKLFHRSPSHLDDFWSGLTTDKKTKALEFGTELHGLVFEGKRNYVLLPEKFKREELQCPNCDSIGKGQKCSACNLQRELVKNEYDWSGNATECKEWLAAQTLAVLTKEEETMLNASHAAIIECDAFKKLKKSRKPRTEVSMFATDPITKLQLKCRADYLDKSFILELKSTIDGSTWAFNREIGKRGYHIQAAINYRVSRLLGLKIKKFYYLVLEKGESPKVNFGEFDAISLRASIQKLDESLLKIAECKAKNKWPGYCDDVPNTFSLPDYLLEVPEELDMEN
jgi:hypothetical protein